MLRDSHGQLLLPRLRQFRITLWFRPTANSRVSRWRFGGENIKRYRPNMLRLEDGHSVQTTVARHDVASNSPQAIGWLRTVTVDRSLVLLGIGKERGVLHSLCLLREVAR